MCNDMLSEIESRLRRRRRLRLYTKSACWPRREVTKAALKSLRDITESALTVRIQPTHSARARLSFQKGFGVGAVAAATQVQVGKEGIGWAGGVA